MQEEEKSIVELLNLNYGLFYRNRRFIPSNPIFDGGKLKLEKYSDDLLVYKPIKNGVNSHEGWDIFEKTFSTLITQSSKPIESQEKTFNLSKNDIGLLIPILIIEYRGEANESFQSIINKPSQSNVPDFRWIGEFFAKKVLVGGALVIKDAFQYSYNSLGKLKSLIIKSINKFRYGNKNSFKKTVTDSEQLSIFIEDLDGNLLKNTETMHIIQQLYEFKEANVITYEEVIPTYIFLDTEKQQKSFNKRLVPGISTYHKEYSMSVWIGIQQLIRKCKLEHGLVINANEFISSLCPAVELKLEPLIKLLDTETKLNISHLSTQKELLYITSCIDIFNNKCNLLDKILDEMHIDYQKSAELQINPIHCSIICEKIEIDIEDVIEPSQQLKTEIEEALKKSNPYKELERVFAKYGHVFCIKFSMGGRLTKLNEFSLTEYKFKNVSNNKFEDFESHQETLNAWINLLDRFKMDKNMYIIEESLSHAVAVSNDNIDDWAKSISKNLDSWQVVNCQQFIPLYKLFKDNRLQKEIEFLYSNENRILMTGIAKLKNNKIRYYYEKFNQPLESDEYQIIGSIISDSSEVNLTVSFQMLTVSGFSIVIEELDNKTSTKPIANDLKVYWQLIGNPLSVKYFNKNNRNIRIISGNIPNIKLTREKNDQRIDIEKTGDNFTSDCVIAASFKFSSINFRPKLEVILNSWSDKCINLNIINHSFKEINIYFENEPLELEKINCNLIWYVIYTTQQETITDDELHQIPWKYLGQYLNKEKKELTDDATNEKNSLGEKCGKFNMLSRIVNAIQIVGDSIQPFVPLFSMVTNIVVMNEVAALASSMENLNTQASKSAVRATIVRTPLNEAYKAPMVDPNQLIEPFASYDNVRGSRKTVVKKLFHGLEVACKKVTNIENNDVAQSQKDSFEAKLSMNRTVQGLSAEVENLLDIVRWLAPEKMSVTKNGVGQRYNHQCEMFRKFLIGIILFIKAWQDEPSARPSDLEVQLKLKELYERFQETSPQIRPKDPYCDIEILDLELTESQIEMS
ncbi:7867_t:CDS:2, partial [Dentiscutata erythropus]